MRHLILMLMSCLLTLLTGCTSSILQTPVSDSGEVVISLVQDRTPGEVRTKSDPALPDVSGFKVEIYDIDANRRYCDTYGNSMGKRISLNAGPHRLLAQYGDSTGVGFNSFYYLADQPFDVEGQSVTEIHAVAKMAKVEVAVKFGESISGVYSDWYAKVKTDDSRSVQFSRNEKRTACFPAGNLVLEVYVQEAGQWKYHASEPLACAAGEFVTFTLNTNLNNGKLTAHVTVDNAAEQVDKTITIPSSMAPKKKPSITMKGVEGNSFQLYEACAMKGGVCQADIVAENEISSCILEFSDSSVPGLPAGRYDLISPDPEVSSALEGAGLKWLRDMGRKRLAYVDFSGLLEQIGKTSVYNPADNRLATFRLVVTDGAGCETASQTYSFDVIPSEAEVRIADADIWASEMKKTTVDVLAGDPSLFQLQYRKQGTTDYMTADPLSVSGKQVTFGAIPALDPGTVYELRTIYNGNPYNVTPETSFTTEAPLQIGNAGFEDWTSEQHQFTAWGVANTQVWFKPWTGTTDIWWAVNSKKSLLETCFPGWLTYKVFPTVSYTAAKSASGKAAQITSVGYGQAATSSTAIAAVVPGELWIGQADGSGNHKSDGHAFASRPSKVSYWRKNEPVSGESSSFVLEIRDKEGVVIGKASSVDSAKDNAGKTVTLDIKYTDMNKKAASIYICVKSSTAGSPAASGSSIEMAGKSYNANLGSRILIDDIKLIY